MSLAAASVVGVVSLASVSYQTWTRNRLNATAPLEIRTDPVGASVKLGEGTCVTPKCQLAVRPGEYEILARLGWLSRSPALSPNSRPQADISRGFGVASTAAP